MICSIYKVKRTSATQKDVSGGCHDGQIAGIMAALVAARGEDEARGGGAADPRRWTALRSTVEARAMLKTVFRAAAAHAVQVNHQRGHDDATTLNARTHLHGPELSI